MGFLDACERDVGLPIGQIGNSEVCLFVFSVVYGIVTRVSELVRNGNLCFCFVFVMCVCLRFWFVFGNLVC